MARASPFAEVPIEIDRKVEATGLGLLTSWAPQQLILNSPVRFLFVQSDFDPHRFIGHWLVCVPLRCQQHYRDSDGWRSNVRFQPSFPFIFNRRAIPLGLLGRLAQSNLSTPFTVPIPSISHMNSSRYAPRTLSKCTARELRTRVPSRPSAMKPPLCWSEPLAQTGR